MATRNATLKLTHHDLVNGIKIYRREGGGFGQPVELSVAAGDSLTTDLLPILSIPLVEIFRPAGAAVPRAGSH